MWNKSEHIVRRLYINHANSIFVIFFSLSQCVSKMYTEFRQIFIYWESNGAKAAERDIEINWMEFPQAKQNQMDFKWISFTDEINTTKKIFPPSSRLFVKNVHNFLLLLLFAWKNLTFDVVKMLGFSLAGSSKIVCFELKSKVPPATFHKSIIFFIYYSSSLDSILNGLWKKVRKKLLLTRLN